MKKTTKAATRITDYPYCEALVQAGLMRRHEGHELSGGDLIYSVTGAGRTALRQTSNDGGKRGDDQERSDDGTSD